MLARGRRIAAEAGVEGLQEYGAAVAQNLIEQGIYNPEQGTFEGSGEAFGYGAGVGGFVQGIVEMIAPRRGARTSPTPEETDATDEILAIEQEKPVALLPAPPKGLPAPPKGLPAPSGLPVTPEGQAVTPAQESELEAQRADREATLADMPSAEVLKARTDLAEQAEPLSLIHI